ncbi:C40 family peptidase [Kocuria sp. JC486]|uniref:C40 family peptidase n=1 Tax=Kocuria sp. JC486 TaxID=1970736 RepID=UPI001FD74FA2|nr:C40 family peptidase [Kocuria sp. JC486]
MPSATRPSVRCLPTDDPAHLSAGLSRGRLIAVGLAAGSPSTPRVTTAQNPCPAQRRAWVLGGAAGLGAIGAAALGAAPAHASPVEFPDWVTVTGTVPDGAGLDLAAAEANNWTFSWSTDANGVVTFVYADGTTSNSANPPAAPAASTGTDVTTQSEPTALWSTDAGGDPAVATSDPGMNDLAAAVSAPFGGDPAATTGGPVAQPEGQEPAASAGDQAILDTAYQGLGGAYIWGGTDFMAWDCSGYVQWVYAQHGIEIPRVTWDQFAAGTPTTTPRPGDLVSQNGGSHVGIYLGGDQMISALNPEQGTIVHSVHAMPLDGYYTYR